MRYAGRFFIGWFGLFAAGCFESDYTKLVRQELGRNIRMDSVVLGINLGDTREEFYGKCFDLNKDSLVTQGPDGATVQFFFSDSLFHDKPTPIRLLFIPRFDPADTIAEINMEYSYVGWAPWNRHLQSDTLFRKVQRMLLHRYGGNEFVFPEIAGNRTPVKVDGNRRMIVYVKDERNVVVKVQDLLNNMFKHSISK
jgi:hypothetical protein